MEKRQAFLREEALNPKAAQKWINLSHDLYQRTKKFLLVSQVHDAAFCFKKSSLQDEEKSILENRRVNNKYKNKLFEG